MLASHTRSGRVDHLLKALADPTRRLVFEKHLRLGPVSTLPECGIGPDKCA